MVGAGTAIEASASQRVQRGAKWPSGKTYMNRNSATKPTNTTTADDTSQKRGSSNRCGGKVKPVQFSISTSDTKKSHAIIWAAPEDARSYRDRSERAGGLQRKEVSGKEVHREAQFP
jgi:hypothetical protein